MTDTQNPLDSFFDKLTEASTAPQTQAKPVTPQRKKPAAEPKQVLLSRLLRAVPPEECALIFQNWDTAILEGKVRAVPYQGKVFTQQIIDLKGREQEVQRPDELVELTPAFQAWMTSQREKARYIVLAYRGDIAITSRSNREQFDLLLKARVLRLRGAQTNTKGGSGE